MNDEELNEGFDLLVPFVVCSDHGGPFDPHAFTAGFEMGLLFKECAVMQAIGRPSMRKTIRRENMPQADLIVMHFGMELLEEQTPEVVADDLVEWAFVIFGYDIIDDTGDEATQ